mmetsp:Transcript_6110/g.9555  ORF Transcript_6110/g.9555 Transcript_6110/m.9555 type:complete len:216 (-) Transcript_6110:853-1500(-)
MLYWRSSRMCRWSETHWEPKWGHMHSMHWWRDWNLWMPGCSLRCTRCRLGNLLRKVWRRCWWCLVLWSRRLCPLLWLLKKWVCVLRCPLPTIRCSLPPGAWYRRWWGGGLLRSLIPDRCIFIGRCRVCLICSPLLGCSSTWSRRPCGRYICSACGAFELSLEPISEAIKMKDVSTRCQLFRCTDASTSHHFFSANYTYSVRGSEIFFRSVWKPLM